MLSCPVRMSIVLEGMDNGCILWFNLEDLLGWTDLQTLRPSVQSYSLMLTGVNVIRRLHPCYFEITEEDAG